MSKQIVFIVNAFSSKKQKIQLTEAHAINNCNYSQEEIYSLSQRQYFNSVPSPGCAVLGVCLPALFLPPHGYKVAATSLSITSVFKAEMRRRQRATLWCLYLL